MVHSDGHPEGHPKSLPGFLLRSLQAFSLLSPLGRNITNRGGILPQEEVIYLTLTPLLGFLSEPKILIKIKMKVYGSYVKAKMTTTTARLALMLDQKITIDESYFPEFSTSNFFASLGGSLGLWLGIGGVQLLSNSFDMITWIKAYITQ